AKRRAEDARVPQQGRRRIDVGRRAHLLRQLREWHLFAAELPFAALEVVHRLPPSALPASGAAASAEGGRGGPLTPQTTRVDVARTMSARTMVRISSRDQKGMASSSRTACAAEPLCFAATFRRPSKGRRMPYARPAWKRSDVSYVIPTFSSRPSGLARPGVFSAYQACAYIVERISSNPVSSPPRVWRPVCLSRTEGWTQQAQVTDVNSLGNSIMSTFK